MKAEEAYDWLIAASGPSLCDAFDVHVVAAIFGLAFAEADSGERTIAFGVGLDGGEIAEVVAGRIEAHRSRAATSRNGFCINIVRS